MKRRILILCTRNSARSQMAEGLLNSLYGDLFDAYSAGTEPSQVNTYAIKVMEEIGIDISHHSSKHMSEFYGQRFDIVVTVCDNAKKVCPTFPGAKKMIHHGFTDPATAQGSEEEILTTFRSVRDEINKWIQKNLLN